MSGDAVDPVVVEVIEALRAARELCAYLSHNIDNDEKHHAPNVWIEASSVRHAEQVAALLSDLQERADRVLCLLDDPAPGAEALTW